MNLKEVNEALNLYVRPQTFPLAIKMCQSSSEFPEKVRMPKRDLGISVTICQGIAMARRYGWTIAIGKEDQCCPHGAFVLGFVPGKGYLDGSYAESLGLGTKEQFAKTAHSLSRLEYGKYSHILAAPLHFATFEPHLILIFGNPAQVARLVQGALTLTGGVLTSVSSSGIACSGFIARPILTQECQFILSGAGDRYFALTQDHELAFTIPTGKIESTIQGLEIGHKSGMHRYPTPSFLRFEGQLPPAYYKFLKLLKKEEQ
ncbi:MAG: hypothetical protein FJ006_04060 [Chloroflexi bacterium]|nr:hypothetical protein [Chloroflexota bacterium]